MSQDLRDFIGKNKKIFDGQVTEVNSIGQYKVFSPTLGRNVTAKGSYTFNIGDKVLLGRENDNFLILNNKRTTVLSNTSSSAQLNYISDSRVETYTEDEQEGGFITPVIFRGTHIAWPVRYYYFEGSTSQANQPNQIGAFSFITGVGGTTNTGLVNPRQGVTYNCWVEGFLDVKTNMTFPEKWARSDSWPLGQQPKSRELKKKFETTLATSSTGGFGSAFGVAPFSRSFSIIDLTIKRQGIGLLGEQIIKSLASNVFDFMATDNLVDTMVQLPPFVLPSFDKTEYGLATRRSAEDLFRNNMVDGRNPQESRDYSDPRTLLVPNPGNNNELTEITPDPFNSTVVLEREDSFDTDFIRFIRINSAELENARITNSLNGTYPVYFGYIYPLWNTRTDSTTIASRFQVGTFENGGITFAIGNSAWEFIAFIRDFSLPPPEVPDDGIERPDIPFDPDDYIRPVFKDYVLRNYPFYTIYKPSVEPFIGGTRNRQSGLDFFRELLPDYRVDLTDFYNGSSILNQFFRNVQIRVGTDFLTINGYGARQAEVFPFLVFNNNGLTDLDYEGVTFTSPAFDEPINIEAVSTSTSWIKKATVEVLVQDSVANPQYEGIEIDVVYDEGTLLRGEYDREPISFNDLNTSRWREIRRIDEIDLSAETINGTPPLEGEGIIRCKFKTTEQPLPPGQKWVKYCTIYRPDVNGGFTSGRSIRNLINFGGYIGLGNPTNSAYIYLYEHEGIEGVLKIRYTIDQVFRIITCVETINGIVCRLQDSKQYNTATMFPTIRLLSFQNNPNLGSFYKDLGFKFNVTTDSNLLPLNPELGDVPPDSSNLATGFLDGNAGTIRETANYGTRKAVRLPDPSSSIPSLRVSPIAENIYLQASLSRSPFTYDYLFDVVNGERVNKRYESSLFYPPLLKDLNGIGDIVTSPYPDTVDSNRDAIRDSTWKFYDRISYMLFAPFNFELYSLLGSDRTIFRNKTNFLLQAYEWFDLRTTSGVFI